MIKTRNFCDAELRLALHDDIHTGAIRVDEDDQPYFDSLAEAFPASGSKIAWSRVSGSIEECEPMPERQPAAFLAFFERMIRTHNLAGPVAYVGDSGSTIALIAELPVFLKHLATIAALPQHHYFFPRNVAWCLVLTMEGDMAFGYRPQVV